MDVMTAMKELRANGMRAAFHQQKKVFLLSYQDDDGNEWQTESVTLVEMFAKAQTIVKFRAVFGS